MSRFTPYHSQYLAHRITLEGVTNDSFARSLSTARVDMNPHQVDAALFALKSPLSRGVILADEVGLGKTIEASLVIAQRWAERRRRILLITPASLRKQWLQELQDKFSLPAQILEAKTCRDMVKTGNKRPFDVDGKVVVSSYEFAAGKADDIARINWDLVIFDEAHRLRNVYRHATAVRAKALRDAVRERFKILLTATPMQNSLMELFGLTSMIDDKVFGDEKSFRQVYASAHPTTESLMLLRHRLKPFCRRTLRKDVQNAGHINFTRRTASTFKFEPGQDEFELYAKLSAYLQRRDTIAFGSKPNQLVTLVVRKILGSSTFAVAITLNTIIERLGNLEQPQLDDITDDDIAAEKNEEWDDGDDSDASPGPDIDPVKLKAEIEELTGYRDLAESIPVNAKGQKLIAVLPQVMTSIVKLGGQRKAVIFTESVRTQTYLSELLTQNGYDGEIVLLNGSNSDPQSQAIYAAWKSRNKGTDAVSGSRSADMKAAIVDAFRHDKSILIATESGAEGINLQFCSLLVNFDLPWNPQRVEQRIGRCHRYGQKIDVTVVNLLNEKNQAEKRIFELLDQKFRLFDGVFGASDEVLGAIENGVDFERKVLEIVQSAQTEDEINEAFNRLQKELHEQIDGEVLDARKRLLEAVDESVVRRLKSRKGDIESLMSDFERRLVVLAKAELPDAEFHDDGTPRFDFNGQTWTPEWPLADERGWQFLRLTDGNLGQALVIQAKERSLPPSVLRFNLDAYDGGRLSDLDLYRGKSGWLRASKLSVRMAGQVTEHLLLAMVAETGEVIPQDVADRLFLVPASTLGEPALAPPTSLDQVENDLRQACLRKTEGENDRWMEQETEKLDLYAEDMERATDAEIKAVENEIKARRNALRASGLGVARKVEERRAIKKLEGRRDDLMLSKFERKKAIRSEVEDILDQVQESLKLEPTTDPLFTIRWEMA